MTTLPTHEEVLAALPADGTAITAYELVTKLGRVWATDSAVEVRTVLLELQAERRADLKHGFGWYILPAEVTARAKDPNPVRFVDMTVRFADGRNVRVENIDLDSWHLPGTNQYLGPYNDELVTALASTISTWIATQIV